MTIKHLIDENFSPKPREQQGHYFIEFALAFDPTQNLIVQERVMLVRLHSRPPAEHDFQFGIFETTVGNAGFTSTPTDFAHASVRRFIKPIDRPKVKACVCRAAGDLIDEAKPSKITMHTDEPNLNSNGLTKYDDICKAFEAKHYELEQVFDAPDGYRYWSFIQSDLNRAEPITNPQGMTLAMMTREELVRACNEAHETAKRLTAPVPQARYVEWLRALKLEAKKESAVRRVWDRIVNALSTSRLRFRQSSS